jgi:hypothetical protein
MTSSKHILLGRFDCSHRHILQASTTVVRNVVTSKKTFFILHTRISMALAQNWDPLYLPHIFLVWVSTQKVFYRAVILFPDCPTDIIIDFPSPFQHQLPVNCERIVPKSAFIYIPSDTPTDIMCTT